MPVVVIVSSAILSLIQAAAQLGGLHSTRADDGGSSRPQALPGARSWGEDRAADARAAPAPRRAPSLRSRTALPGPRAGYRPILPLPRAQADWQSVLCPSAIPVLSRSRLQWNSRRRSIAITKGESNGNLHQGH